MRANKIDQRIVLGSFKYSMQNLKGIIVLKKFSRRVIWTLKSLNVELFNLFERFEGSFSSIGDRRRNQVSKSIDDVGSKISEICMGEPFVWWNEDEARSAFRFGICIQISSCKNYNRPRKSSIEDKRNMYKWNLSDKSNSLYGSYS